MISYIDKIEGLITPSIMNYKVDHNGQQCLNIDFVSDIIQYAVNNDLKKEFNNEDLLTYAIKSIKEIEEERPDLIEIILQALRKMKYEKII